MNKIQHLPSERLNFRKLLICRIYVYRNVDDNPPPLTLVI